MYSSEASILALNLSVILIAYFFIYPKFCGNDGMKIANNDAIASCLVLIIAGIRFWDSGQSFNLVLFSCNWFWFTLLSYAALELPLMLWYFKKHNIWSTFKLK